MFSIFIRKAHPFLVLVLGAILVYALVPFVGVDLYRLFGQEFVQRGEKPIPLDRPGYRPPATVRPDMNALFSHGAIIVFCSLAIWWVLRSRGAPKHKLWGNVWIAPVALLLLWELTFFAAECARERRQRLAKPHAMLRQDGHWPMARGFSIVEF